MGLTVALQVEVMHGLFLYVCMRFFYLTYKKVPV